MNGHSIQDIVPPARSRPVRQAPVVPPKPPMMLGDTSEPGDAKWKYFLVAGLVAIILVGTAIAIMSTIFHTATVKVNLHAWKFDATNTYEASDTLPLSFQIVSEDQTASKQVAASGTTKAEDRAFGTITISNTYSTKPQRYITSTRFESPDGKVFRIHEPVVVPGYTMRGSTKVAGTVSVTVYADQPGDTYNIQPTTFTLPGLKKSPQYSTITARSTQAFVGGYIGTRAVVDPATRAQVVSELRADLARQTTDALSKAVPAGSILFPNSITYTYTDLPDVSNNESSATISVKATASAPAYPEEQLSRAVANVGSVQYDDPLTLVNWNELVYTMATGSSSHASSTKFSLSGVAQVVADFDPNQFAKAVANKGKAAVDQERSKFPAITGPMSVLIYPFWMSSLPKERSIKVEATAVLDQ